MKNPFTTFLEIWDVSLNLKGYIPSKNTKQTSVLQDEPKDLFLTMVDLSGFCMYKSFSVKSTMVSSCMEQKVHSKWSILISFSCLVNELIVDFQIYNHPYGCIKLVAIYNRKTHKSAN